METHHIFAAALFVLSIAAPVQAQENIRTEPLAREVQGDIEMLRDVEFGKGGARTLHMHIARPNNAEACPAIVFVHGGAWRTGSRNDGLPFITDFAKHGFVAASIDYRLSTEAKFPAQIEDCKCAVRFLRAKAAEFHIDESHIGAMGPSAGGHLVALLGTSGDVKELEGQGGWSEFSSRVQAVCDWFGPVDFFKMAGTPATGSANSVVTQLFGADPDQARELARKASPLTYISKDTPPFLIVHGSSDSTVSVEQSEILADALKKAGVPVTLRIIEGAGHGGPAFSTSEIRQAMIDFFEKVLKRKTAEP